MIRLIKQAHLSKSGFYPFTPSLVNFKTCIMKPLLTYLLVINYSNKPVTITFKFEFFFNFFTYFSSLHNKFFFFHW